jgi:hypothetical protein
MDDPIVGYISILTNNSITAKYREIPDEFEHADELLAEIENEMEGNLPDSMRDFELNGFTSPVDLEEFFENRFNLFKTAFIISVTPDKLNLISEINEQLNKASNELILLKQAYNHYNDITLASLIDCKIQYYKKTLAFLSEKNNTITIKDIVHKEDPHALVFRVKNEFKKNGYDIIHKLHQELKKAGYLDCNFREFKKLFILPGEKMPEYSPTPVVWHANYTHLSYFLTLINRSFLIRTEKPGNNEIAINLFIRSDDGSKFSPSKPKYQSHANLEVKRRFESIMRWVDIPKNTTFRE